MPGTPPAENSVVCVDLDRTLIYSSAALGLSGADADLPRLLCVELYEGRPLSYVTESAAAGIELLAAAATLVPTTTRTPEQYARVHLLGEAPAYAICANGGHLLVDGRSDPEWAAGVRVRVSACAEPAEVYAHLSRISGDFVRKLRMAADLFCYAVVERGELPEGWVAELAGWCAERGWTTSLQGRKVYCLPKPLTKAAAAAEVARRTGADVLLAAGDSLLDTELLEAADAAIRPPHGELAETGWIGEGTSVSVSGGVYAGEEIVGWLLERALNPGGVPRRGAWREKPLASR
ncbi:HAD family hydrolase [Actinomadura alba]|uniref:HAD family hydrolase n=1 Tax=Actinomadura alba TaxID=406431 RepID=A0ABR7LGU2_9ACTN|nr:HAD family hydrolase [Actinomadura alba]MBC6463908.1 HAD family hydrolase [Actinomadura alba]